jgi:hypothetical protein
VSKQRVRVRVSEQQRVRVRVSNRERVCRATEKEFRGTR